MKIYVHIGIEKTGTTSIQSSLIQNFKLLEKNGIEVVGNKIHPYTINNFGFVLASKNNPGGDLSNNRIGSYDDYRNSFQDDLKNILDNYKIDKIQKAVISSEHLSSRLTTIGEIESFKSLFPDYVDFQIIVYVRKQDDLLLGSQAESIKAGVGSINYKDPRLISEYQPYGLVYYDYSLLLNLWESAFGHENIDVRVFEKKQLEEGNVVVDFLKKLLGEEIYSYYKSRGLVKYGSKSNRRLSPEALWFLSQINRSVKRENRQKIIQKIMDIDNYEKGSLISNEILNDFFLSFEKSNIYVAKRYLSRYKLFLQSFKPYRTLEYFPDDYKIEIMIKFMNHLLKEIDIL